MVVRCTQVVGWCAWSLAIGKRSLMHDVGCRRLVRRVWCNIRKERLGQLFGASVRADKGCRRVTDRSSHVHGRADRHSFPIVVEGVAEIYALINEGVILVPSWGWPIPHLVELLAKDPRPVT